MKSSAQGDTRKEEVTPKESVTTEMNQSDLFKIVQDLKSEIDTLKAERNKTKDDVEYEIAAEDFLEVPVIFFAYSSAFSIHGDRRFGKPVEVPNGEGVKFKKAYRYEQRSAGKRGVDIVSTCSVKVQSEKLANWLRSHSLYGIKFFETLRDAQNVDVSIAEKMVEINSMISNMSDMQIIERAKTVQGVNINTPDINQIRRQLVEKMARIELDAESTKKVKRYVDSRVIEDKKIDEANIPTGGKAAGVY